MSGDQAFNALVYKPPEPRFLDYLQNNVARAGEVLGNVGRSFVEQTTNLYDSVNNSAFVNSARAMLMNMGTHLSQDVIHRVDRNNMHEANLTMQQYIMANPNMNKLHQKNMAYGFQETYYDMEPGVYGEERLDFQRVMDGIVRVDKKDEYTYVNHYSNSDDVELNQFEQLTILDTWDEVNSMIAMGIDPSDPLQDEL